MADLFQDPARGEKRRRSGSVSGFDNRRRAGQHGWLSAVIFTAVLLGLKATLAYLPSDRDARDIAAQLQRSVDLRRLDGVLFVDMRPFYGLKVYLDTRIAGLQIGERKFDYSQYVAPEDLCAEIPVPGRHAYAIKAGRLEAFSEAVSRCGATVTRVGTLRADDNDIALLTVAPGTR